MMISIHPPLALHEKGRREKNEDYIYPVLDDKETLANARFFLVCDGVGGAEKGEEASRIVCETFAKNLQRIDHIILEDVERALLMAEYNIDLYVESNPEAEGMATTLTFLMFNEKGAVIAHIGDSRVYHIRDGKILFKTADHSLVNEMVMNNIITAEEAANHPKRNVVSRAIMGRQRPARLDISRISDICPDDYFFLCTDGILESVSDIMLASILGDYQHPNEFKLSQIASLCHQNSRDNFSAYLIKIKSIIPTTTVHEVAEEVNDPGKKRSGLLPRWMAYLLIFSSTTTVLIISIILFSDISASGEQNKAPRLLSEPGGEKKTIKKYLPVQEPEKSGLMLQKEEPPKPVEGQDEGINQEINIDNNN